MTKDELVKIVKLVNANWPVDSSIPKVDIMQLWWKCLSDLEFDAVMDVIDNILVEASVWRPKPGEVRRRVIDAGEPWPSPEAAWGLAEARRFSADMGVDPPEVKGSPGLAEALQEVMRDSAGQGRHGFMATWTKLTGERYALPAHEKSIDGVQLDDAP